MSITTRLTTNSKVLCTSVVPREGKKEATSFSERIRLISDRCLMPWHLLRRWLGGSEVSFYTHDTGTPLQKGTEFSVPYFTVPMEAEANSITRGFVNKEMAAAAYSAFFGLVFLVFSRDPKMDKFVTRTMLIGSVALRLISSVIGRTRKEVMQVNEINPSHFPSLWIAYGVMGLGLVPGVVVGAPLKLLVLATDSAFQKKHKTIVNRLQPPENKAQFTVEPSALLSVSSDSDNSMVLQNNINAVVKNVMLKFLRLSDLDVLSRVSKYWCNVIKENLPNWLKVNGLSPEIKAIKGISIHMKELCHPAVWTALGPKAIWDLPVINTKVDEVKLGVKDDQIDSLFQEMTVHKVARTADFSTIFILCVNEGTTRDSEVAVNLFALKRSKYLGDPAGVVYRVNRNELKFGEKGWRILMPEIGNRFDATVIQQLMHKEVANVKGLNPFELF